MSEVSRGPGWWQASDGNWYPSEQPSPGGVPAAPSQQWSTIESAGALLLAHSGTEYAVYDGQHTYGRWPLTPAGLEYAKDTFRAYSQSQAHGVAYAVAGYRDPAAAGLPIEPTIKSQTYAAPLSYVGSTRRLIAWASKLSQRNPGLAIVGWVVAIVAALFAWTFITAWYFIIFGLFGVFVIPYRLVRRSQRKTHHVQRTMLATQQAMLQQQQALLAQQRSPSPTPAIRQPDTATPAMPPPPVTPPASDG
jgi:hypothetical protein